MIYSVAWAEKITYNGRALRRQGFEKQKLGLITKSKIE